LYKGVQAPILVTDPASAEMIKYASNAFLATKISFVNAIANICEAVNADIREVALGMGYDPRIGFEFLHPGPGWGGSCFPKDTAALVHIAADAGYEFSLLKGAIDVNDEQHRQVVAKIKAGCGGSLAGARIAMWGLTFKANTDDLRDSPSVRIARQLVAQGATVCAFDPIAGDTARVLLPEIDIASDPYEACSGADVLTVLTEWDEFRWLDFDRVGTELTARRVRPRCDDSGSRTRESGGSSRDQDLGRPPRGGDGRGGVHRIAPVSDARRPRRDRRCDRQSRHRR
jgi:UDPglucose 6-dehydrogenase